MRSTNASPSWGAVSRSGTRTTRTPRHCTYGRFRSSSYGVARTCHEMWPRYRAPYGLGRTTIGSCDEATRLLRHPEPFMSVLAPDRRVFHSPAGFVHRGDRLMVGTIAAGVAFLPL